METNNFFSEEEHEKVYHGLPITSIAVILPVLYLLHFVLPYTFPVLLMVMLFAVGTLFIADFKMKKPSNKVLALIVAVVAIAIIITFVYSRYKLMNGFVL